MSRNLISLSLVALVATAASAQDRAPRGAAKATVSGKSVAVEYGRPSLKGRKVDNLLTMLPDDRIWRAGVDQVTTLTTETDLTIGGKAVPAGKYSVYVHAPASGDYSLVLNKDLGVPLGEVWKEAPAALAKEPWPRVEDYTQAIGAKEVARVPMKNVAPATPVDLFTIDLTPAGKGAILVLQWGDRLWSVDVSPAR